MIRKNISLKKYNSFNIEVNAKEFAEEAKFTNQDHSQATYAKKIDKKETKIHWKIDAKF